MKDTVCLISHFLILNFLLITKQGYDREITANLNFYIRVVEFLTLMLDRQSFS